MECDGGGGPAEGIGYSEDRLVVAAKILQDGKAPVGTEGPEELLEFRDVRTGWRKTQHPAALRMDWLVGHHCAAYSPIRTRSITTH
jgi:hypothetical protein